MILGVSILELIVLFLQLPQGAILPGIKIQAADADNSILTYTILTGTDKAFFSLHKHGGDVKLLQALDYEKQQSYFVNINVTDGTYYDQTSLTVVVRDIDDERPKFKETVYNGVVFTNASHGDSVRLDEAIMAYDPDRAINETLLFQIDSSSCPNWFVIDQKTGEFRVNITVLKQTTCNIDVVALQESNKKSSGPVRVIINVVKGREPPPRFDESHYTYNIPEETKAFTNIIRLSAPGEGVIFDVVGSQTFFVPDKSSYIQLTKALKAKEKSEYNFNVTSRQPALGTNPLATDRASMTVYVTTDEEDVGLSSLAIGMIATCAVLVTIVIIIIILFCCWKRPRSDRQKLDRVSPMKEIHTPLGVMEPSTEENLIHPSSSPRPPPDGETGTPAAGSPSTQQSSKEQTNFTTVHPESQHPPVEAASSQNSPKEQTTPARAHPESKAPPLEALPEEVHESKEERDEYESDFTATKPRTEQRKQSNDSSASDSSGASNDSSFNLPRNPENYHDAKSVEDLRQKRGMHRGDDADDIAERKTSYLDELNFKNTKRSSIQADLARAMDLAQRRDSTMLEQDERLRHFHNRRGSRRDTRASIHAQSGHSPLTRLPPPLVITSETAPNQLRPTSAAGDHSEPHTDSLQALVPPQPQRKVRRDSARPPDAQPVPPQSTSLAWGSRKTPPNARGSKDEERKKRFTAWDETDEYDFKTYEELTLDGEKLKMFSY